MPPTETASPMPSPTAVLENCANKAKFVEETVPDDTAPSGDDDSNEEAPSDRARAPVTLDELPEFRDSADNNITLPVDI